MTIPGGQSALEESTSIPHLHTYTSTACYHEQHEQCKAKCKFCSAPCECECHKEK